MIKNVRYAITSHFIPLGAGKSQCLNLKKNELIMSDKETTRRNFAALMLQATDSLDDFSRIVGLSNNLVRNTKNDLAKKLRPSSSVSARGITKSDMLNAQLLVLLNDVGFDLSTAEFDDDMIITKIIGPQSNVYGFNSVKGDMPSDETLVSLFGKTDEQKQPIIEFCSLKKK